MFTFWEDSKKQQGAPLNENLVPAVYLISFQRSSFFEWNDIQFTKKFHYMRPPLWFFGVLTKCAYVLCWKKIKRILLENNFLGVYLNEIRYNSQELFPILYLYNLYHWYFFVLFESWIVVCLGVNWKMVFISSPINFKFLNSE